MTVVAGVAKKKLPKIVFILSEPEVVVFVVMWKSEMSRFGKWTHHITVSCRFSDIFILYQISKKSVCVFPGD